MPLKFETVHLDAKLWNETPEGYLDVEAPVTCPGVFIYRHGDGSVTKEFRPKEEVHHKDSVDSINLKAITDEHPVNQEGRRFLLDSNTTRQFQKGVVSTPRVDNDYLKAKLRITDKDLIRKIKQGKCGLSCGYQSQDEKQAGVSEFGEYDTIQRNIRYNHLAVVYQGRAGPNVAIKLDAQDAIQIDKEIPMPEPLVLQRVKINPITIGDVKCDVIDFELPKEYAGQFDIITNNIAKLVSVIQTALEDKQKLQGKYDVMEKEIKVLKDTKITNEQLQTLIKNRTRVETAAKHFKVEKFDNLSDQEIKIACLKKKFPNDKFDEANIGYIDGSFDAIYKEVEGGQKGKDDLALLANVNKKTDSLEDKKDPPKLDAREQFMQTRDMWNGKADLGEHDFTDIEKFRFQRQQQGKMSNTL